MAVVSRKERRDQEAAKERANAKLRRELHALYRQVDDHNARGIVESRAQSIADVSCTKGCSACCSVLVEMELAEAENIVARNPSAVARALPTLRRHAQLAAGMPSLMKDRIAACDAWWTAELACAFLQDGLCSVYADRPLMCRTYFVATDPALCAVRPKAIVGIAEFGATEPASRRVMEMGTEARGQTIFGALPQVMLLAIQRAHGGRP